MDKKSAVGVCVPHLLGHLAHTLHAGAVQVAVVLARLNEPMALNVFLHLFSWRHKVIVSPIHLIFPFGPRGVCQKKKKKKKPAVLTQVSTSYLVIVDEGVFKYKNQETIFPCYWHLDHLRGTQDPNLSGNSDNKSSFILSLTGPRMMMGLA